MTQTAPTGYCPLPAGPGWAALPAEALTAVLVHLGEHDRDATGQVCRRWLAATQQPAVCVGRLDHLARPSDLGLVPRRRMATDAPRPSVAPAVLGNGLAVASLAAVPAAYIGVGVAGHVRESRPRTFHNMRYGTLSGSAALPEVGEGPSRPPRDGRSNSLSCAVGPRGQFPVGADPSFSQQP